MQDKNIKQILFSKSNSAKQHERLSKLLKKYPYALNLQYKALESAIELGLHIDTNGFKKLGSYAIDKPFFKLKFKKLSKLGVEITEEVVETVSKKENIGKIEHSNMPNEAPQNANLIPTPPVKQEVNEQNDMMAPKKEKKKSADQAPEDIKFHNWLSGLRKSAKSKDIPEKDSELEPEVLKTKKKKKKNKKKKSKKKYKEYTKFATKQDEILSETLAELMAKQGYTDKAIEMYNRLSLLFPDKNSYFASKIEDLSKK